MALASENPQRSKLANFLLSQKPREIFDRVSWYWTRADFLVFRRVCRAFYQIEGLQRRFNINVLLQPFVSDPSTFRSEQGEHGALISGLFALDFFEFGWPNVPTLDIFVQAGSQAEGFVEYIKDCECYDQESYPEIQIVTVPIILRSQKRPGKAIRVTLTGGPPVETILSCSYSTASVNFISWNKAYSIFPVQTVTHHKYYALRLWDYDFSSLLREQSNHGWTNRDIIWPDLTANLPCPISDGHRRVGDGSSWVISLDTDNIRQPSTPDSVIEYSQFEVFTKLGSLFSQGRSEQHGSPRIRVQKMISPALRHVYTFTSSSWHKFAEERLQRWIWLELFRLRADERPVPFIYDIPHHSNINLPSDFQVPNSWDYADDQIPTWYHQWEQIASEGTDSCSPSQNRRRRRR